MVFYRHAFYMVWRTGESSVKTSEELKTRLQIISDAPTPTTKTNASHGPGVRFLWSFEYFHVTYCYVFCPSSCVNIWLYSTYEILQDQFLPNLATISVLEEQNAHYHLHFPVFLLKFLQYLKLARWIYCVYVCFVCCFTYISYENLSLV